MRRIKLTIAYDGTNYSGWQKQPNSITIQEQLESIIGGFLKENIKLIGASRTDAGVHAYGQVAVFDTSNKMEARGFKGAINTLLPPDIIIQNAEEVHIDFHPRYDSIAKTYEYRVLNRESKLPMYLNMSSFQKKELNIHEMEEASKYLIGEHDFKSFCSVHTSAKTTIRRIYNIDIYKEGQMVVFKIRGNGFLYNMVRIIVGTLIEVGIGKRMPEDVKKILAACDREKAGVTARPQGLTLIDIEY